MAINGHGGAALIALRGAFNWRGNGRGLREEAVAGAFDALDGSLKGEKARKGGENGQRRASDSTGEVLEVGGRADVWGPTVSQRKKEKKRREGCWARELLRWAARALVGRKREGEKASGELGCGLEERRGERGLGFGFCFFSFLFKFFSNLFQTLLFF
jgi:hypothetical protein